MPTTTTRQIEHRDCSFQVRSVGPEGSGKFTGLASNFLNIDSCGSIIDKAAFGATLDHFLSEGFLTYEHCWDRPIGKPTKATVTEQGLVVEGEIYGDMFDGASVLAGMRRGVIKQMSIGFYVDDDRILSADELAGYWQENGYEPTELDLRRGQDGARLITSVTLEEAAICIRGANPATRVSGVRSMLRNLFNLTKRAEPPVPPEDEPKPAEPAMTEDMPEGEDTVDEAEIEAVVARLAEAVVTGLRGCVTDMVREKKAAGANPAEPNTTPEETGPPEGTETEDDKQEEALSALLTAEFLLSDLDIEAALKEGR